MKRAAALEINNVMIDPNIKTRFPGTQDITYLDTAAEVLPPRDVPARRNTVQLSQLLSGTGLLACRFHVTTPWENGAVFGGGLGACAGAGGRFTETPKAL